MPGGSLQRTDLGMPGQVLGGFHIVHALPYHGAVPYHQRGKGRLATCRIIEGKLDALRYPLPMCHGVLPA